MKGARTISHAVFAGALIVVAYVTYSGRLFPFWVMFLIQTAVILSLGWQILRLRRERPQVQTQSLPTLVQAVVITLAVGGAILAITNLSGAMPPVTPSGVPVSNLSDTATDGECRFTYNKAEVFVRPMSDCQGFEKKASLTFAGGWLLFSAVGVWLAHFTSAGDRKFQR